MHQFRMKKTFACDEKMIITIPIGSLKARRDGELLPEKFHCVYRDSYKVFSLHGKPKPLGAAQAIAGVFIVALGLIFGQSGLFYIHIYIYTLPCLVYVVSGMLSYAAGRSPNMHVAKLSFSVNIISLFWSIAALVVCAIGFDTAKMHDSENFKLSQLYRGVNSLIMIVLIAEKLIAIFLIYWQSKAICREHFNTLPIILLKQGE